MEKIAQVMTYGKQKYGRDNWRGGIVYSRLLAAVLRHINAYRKGETYDPETGLSHLSHASCGLMMLLEFEETRPDLDDRSLKQEKKTEVATDLHAAAEQAHKDITEMTAKRKFPTTYSIEKLDEINHVMRRNVKFQIGDIVKHINNDAEVTVEGTYFDINDKPILFVKDAAGKVFGVDPSFYRGIYVEKKEAQ